MRFAVGDIETDPFRSGDMPHAFASGFYDGKNLTIHYDDDIPADSDEVWYGKKACRLLAKDCQKFRGPVYFHNGGRFDLYHLLDFLPLRSLVVDNTIGSRMVKVSAGETTYLDSYALIPKPLASWGKEKWKMSYEKMSRARRAEHKEQIIEHLKGDLRQLHSMLAEFFQRFGKNLTLASTAFKVMEKQFGVKIPRTSERHDSFFRRWYFAGRVEFFSLGRHVGNFSVLDINSAFPHAMLENHWGEAECSYGTRIPRRRMEQSFYHVRCNPGGSLPHRCADGSVSFPHVAGEYFACGWELKQGIRCGAIQDLQVIGVWTPQELSSMGKFVNHYYELKKQAKIDEDFAEEFFDKIVLNSSYGKYAIQPNRFRDVSIRAFRRCPCGKNHVDGPPCKEGWEISYDDESRGLTFYQRRSHDDTRGTQKPKRYYNVCTAASITSLVRARLSDAARRVQRLLYTDTDSIICGKYRGLKIGSGLGEWKLEMECDVIWIGGKKLYAAHNRKYFFYSERPSRRYHAELTAKGLVSGVRADWFKIDDLGWSHPCHFKTAAKGVRLKVPDLIAVCEGEERSHNFDPPSYSPFSPSRFVSRRINRADHRKIPQFPSKKLASIK